MSRMQLTSKAGAPKKRPAPSTWINQKPTVDDLIDDDGLFNWDLHDRFYGRVDSYGGSIGGGDASDTMSDAGLAL